MIVVMAAIVAGMNHPEMSGQLVNHAGKIFSKVRVPCVQADADFSRVERPQYPEKVPRPPGE